VKVVVANQRKEDTTWRTTVNREYAEMFARGRHEAPSCTTTTALMTARLSTACRTRHDVGLHTNSHSDGVHSPHRRRHTDRSIAFASWCQCGPPRETSSLGSLESAASLQSSVCHTHTDIDTDHATPPVAVGRIYSIHAMRPNNQTICY